MCGCVPAMAELFATAPSVAQLDDCRLSDLLELAVRYAIPVSRSLRKAAVGEALLEKGVLGEPV